MLVFAVIFLIVSVQPAFFTSAAATKEKPLNYITMKEKKLNTYLNVFMLFAIAGSIMAFISGIDSIFDNPLGLIAVSIFLGVVIAAIIVGGYALLSWIAPKWAKKNAKDFFCISNTDEELK